MSESLLTWGVVVLIGLTPTVVGAWLLSRFPPRAGGEMDGRNQHE